MFDLEPIPDVKPEWEIAYRIRALAKDGKSAVLNELADLRKTQVQEYKKLLTVIRSMAHDGLDHLHLKKHIKPSKRHDETYELRPGKGQIRLFFFYHPELQDIVVCTNTYWKAGDKPKKQDQAFEKCHRLRTAYLAWLAQTQAPGREQP